MTTPPATTTPPTPIFFLNNKATWFFAIILSCAFAFGADKPTKKAPSLLSKQQYQAVTDLVHSTQEIQKGIQANLLVNQRHLTEAYIGFELENTRINDIQNQLISNQQKLLDNYHNLQAELRHIVGPEAFPSIKSRIDAYLKGQASKKNDPTVESAN